MNKHSYKHTCTQRKYDTVQEKSISKKTVASISQCLLFFLSISQCLHPSNITRRLQESRIERTRIKREDGMKPVRPDEAAAAERVERQETGRNGTKRREIRGARNWQGRRGGDPSSSLRFFSLCFETEVRLNQFTA